MRARDDGQRSLTPVRDELARLRGPLIALSAVSFVSNLLMLTGPLFMLQVYDRVLSSRSMPTLVVLTVLVALLFAFYAFLEALRGRMTLRMGNVVDDRLSGRLFRTSIRLRLAPGAPANADPIRDGDEVRQFLSSPPILAFLDVPWVPLYIAIVFLLHPLLGWLAVAGTLVILALLVLSEFLSRRLSSQSSFRSLQRQRRAEDARINAESVLSMGMLPRVQARWQQLSQGLRDTQNSATDRSSAVSSASKGLRFFLQSAVLAVGAYLVIQGELTGGAMIAASVITARALAPVEQVVAQWRTFVSARQAAGRVQKSFSLPDLEKRSTLIPVPTESIEVASAATAPPGSTRPIVSGLSFSLNAGDALGVIGPSGSGKTSVARMLTGLWPALAGSYRLDKASIDHFDTSQLGRVIGYLPQRVELFDGTVADNIARFPDGEVSAAVISAAQSANVHELISSLPNGYDTVLGEGGAQLSAGQRQRIGLARALYDDPFLVVLDEPNSNLDAEGDAALTEAIGSARARGAIVVVVAHRPSAIQATSHVLVLSAGRQASFGTKAEVLGTAHMVGEATP